jgi:uncharacterized protein (TIGR04255 family)
MFPIYERVASPGLPQIGQVPQFPPEILQMLSSQFGSAPHQFRTEDGTSTLTLTGGSLSLSTTKYREWKDFREQMSLPLQALIELYVPAFFARVGLRYIDAIDRESLELGDRAWSELLQPAILGELATPQFERNLENAGRQIRVRIPDGTGTVTLRHGYAVVIGRPQMCYVIDFDFSKEQRVEVSDAEQILDRFNKLAGNAFRWCITPLLHGALEPVPAEHRTI